MSNSNIVKEIKNVTVAKGYNPERFLPGSLWRLRPASCGRADGRDDDSKALIPKTPGLLAAYGLLTENMRRDFVQTKVTDLHGDSFAVLRKEFCILETEAAAWFDSEEIPAEKRALEYFLDMRYKGQNHEIRVPLDMKEVKDSGAIAEAFIKAYERLYSFSTDDMMQIVNFGLSAVGDIVYPVITEGGICRIRRIKCHHWQPLGLSGRRQFCRLSPLRQGSFAEWGTWSRDRPL